MLKIDTGAGSESVGADDLAVTDLASLAAEGDGVAVILGDVFVEVRPDELDSETGRKLLAIGAALVKAGADALQ